MIASLGLGVSVMDNINTRSTKHLKIDDDGLYHQRHYYIDPIGLGCFSNILIEVLLGLQHSYIQYRQKLTRLNGVTKEYLGTPSGKF